MSNTHIMDLSPFSLFPSPSSDETPFYKYHHRTYLHLPLVLHINSYHLYFYGRRFTPTSTVVVAAVKQPRKKKENKREVSAGTIACGSQNQYIQSNTLEHEPKNVLLWREMIGDSVKNGLFEEALRLYYQMQHSGTEPDKMIFISVINACGSILALQAGREIHQDILARGLESDVYVGTALASMYVKCRRLENARQVFDRIPERNVVSWNVIIAGYSRNGHPHEALVLFNEMQVQGIKPNSITMVNVLPACADLLALEQGKQIHGYVIKNGFESDIVVSTGLVGMYVRCGNVNIADKLFERMPQRNVVSWTAIIAGYSQNGQPYEALSFFKEMQVQNIKPNSITMVSVLPACADLLALKQGKQIHGHIIRSGFESNVVVVTGLIDMYAKCGNVNIAHKLFERFPQLNVASWNAIIGGYSQNGHPLEALTFFSEMQVQGIKPNVISIVGVLPACANLLALEQGKQIHGYAIRNGFESDVVVGTVLVDMYAKCRNIEIAHKLFERMPQRNVVSWNAFISGYSRNRHPHATLAFFNKMQVEGIKPDSITMISVLPACADLLALEQGKQIHGNAIRSGFISDVVVGNGLVDMYGKCGHIGTAQQVFERMPKRDVVSWTAIIAGYSQNGHPHEALAFFNEMIEQSIKPDSVTMLSVLPPCADLLALEQGKQIHGYVIRRGFEADVLGIGLVDMYAKCGYIGIARQVFDKISNRNVVSWNAMILGYGIHGHGEDALALFSQMQQTGTKPDLITFIGVLTACSHAGLVKEGWQYFECMKSDYGLAPELDHYACLVDLLGRAGHLDEAHDIIKNMPLEPDVVVWGALLGGCRIHCNIELGEQIAKHLFELKPNAGYYVLLSNIYAEAGRWEDVVKLRTMMKEREVKKQPGCSFIEVNREVHTFLVGDRTHPQSEKNYAVLETLYEQMKEIGYVPNTNLVLQDVEEELKENMLCTHSEKLAIAFGIINTSLGTPIRVMKNLRVCNDCHNVTKFISKIVGREIIVRDANRFHHLNNGLCSCRDYW